MSRPFLLLLFSYLAQGAVAGAVPLIIDTDIGGGGCMDVDDVAAVCIAHAMVDTGEVEILALVQDTTPKLGAGVLSVLNHYYGHDDVPIGAYKGDDLNPDAGYLSYVPDLVKNFDSPINSTSQVPSSDEVYRRALANAADGSVVISSIGLLTALRSLLESPPDDISPLSGYDLVSRKVKALAVMGGNYPTTSSGPECNFCGCAYYPGDMYAATAPAATAFVVNNMPENVRVVFSGFEIGIRVQSGGRLSSCQPADNPCRRAFEDYGGGPGISRFSWDPLSTLAIVRGPAAASCTHCTQCDGTNVVDGIDGRNAWEVGSTTNQTYLVLEDAIAAGEAIDSLLCQAPLV